MTPFRPVDGQAPTPEDTRHILRIACGAFRSLVNDPALRDDLAYMVDHASKAAQKLPEGKDALRGYLIAFRQVEIEILRNAHVPEAAITVMDEAIAAMIDRGGVDWSDFEAVEEKLRTIQEAVCRYAADPQFAKEPKPQLGKLVIDATVGSLVGAADMGVVIAGAAAAAGAAPAIAAATAAAGAGAAAGAAALAGLSLTVPCRTLGNLYKYLS